MLKTINSSFILTIYLGLVNFIIKMVNYTAVRSWARRLVSGRLEPGYARCALGVVWVDYSKRDISLLLELLFQRY